MLQTLTPFLLRVCRSVDALRRWLILVVIAGLVPATRATLASKRHYDVPAGDAVVTLREFVEQSGEQVIYLVPKVHGVKTHAVKGEYTAREVIERMVANTVLVVVQEEKTGALMVNRALPTRPPPDRSSPSKSNTSTQNEPSRTMNSKNVFKLLSGWLVAAAASGQAVDPAAINTDPGGETVRLEAFTVTGSNIRRADAETALPVSVIDASDIDLRGVVTMAELFETLPMAEPSVINESDTAQLNARGDVASIDLRGLGVGNTLTLVNGRRMAPFPATTPSSSVPQLGTNINNIPSSLVSRVEILRDGASAIYGADAAAGVINNLISRTREGREISTRVGVTEHGGANEFRFTASEGFMKGKTHISATIEYFHRDALTAMDRQWSAQADQRKNNNLPAPWNGLPLVDANGTTVRDDDFDNRQAITRYGAWQRGFLQPNGSFVGSRPEGNAGIITSTAPSPIATMSATGTFNYWQTASGEMNWKQTAPSRNIDNPEQVAYEANVNKWRFFLPRTDRVQFATFIDRPLNDRISFFGDLMYYYARSLGGYEPVNINSADMSGGVVPASNPWNPFGVRFYHPEGLPNADGTPRLRGTPADVFISTGVRLPEFKARPYQVDSHAYRALAGVRGKFAGDWEWESGLLFSGAQMHGADHYTMRESRVRRALARTDQTALNLFGYTFKVVDGRIQIDKPYTNPDSVIDPLYHTANVFGRTELLVWDAKANGQLWQLFNGGRINVAIGGDLRWESFVNKRAAFDGVNPPEAVDPPWLRPDDNDVINNSPRSAIDSSQTIYSFYTEVSLPFVTQSNRKLLLQGLELTLAGRFEHFSIHGQAQKPKASLVWKPAPWLKFRGSYNESFRAPNLAQTNVNPTRSQISTTDYYRQGVTGLAADGAILRTNLVQGNNELEPEEAKSWVAGFVVDVPKVRGLSAMFDYWRIKQTNAFANFGTAATMRQDELYLDLATQQALAAGVPIDQIDLGSGTSGYKGYQVLRRAVTAEDRALFAAYNARQATNATKRAPVGEFVHVVNGLINLGLRDLEGYEIGLQYRLPRTSFGQFTLKGDVTRYLRRQDQVDAASPVLSSLNKDGSASWRANLSLAWRKGQWAAGWFTNYYGSYVDTSAATTKPVWDALGNPDYIREFYDNGIVRYPLRIDPVITHNANVSYRFGHEGHRWLRGVTARLGINNVFDKEPPIMDEVHGYLSGAVNPRGRMYTLDITKAF